MAFWLTSAVHRERFLLNGMFVQRFLSPSGQAFFFWKSVGCGKRFLQLFLDRSRPFLHRLYRSSSGHEQHHIWKPNHHHFYARP